MKSGIKRLRTMLILVFALVCLSGFGVSAATLDTVKLTGTCDYTKAYEVLDLVNKERSSEGLSSLTMDRDLINAAMQRAAETAVYSSHTRPNGQVCTTVSDKAYGENIAGGSGGLLSTASSVMDSWMGSEGHRKNILNSGYQSIGIGCFIQNGVTYWVQLFGYSPAEKVSQPFDAKKTFTVELDAGKFNSYISLVSSNGFKIRTGKKDSLTVRIQNPGWTSVSTVLDNDSFTWTSSSSAATVSKKGVVTGAGKGTSTVTAKGPNGKLKATHKVTVTGRLSTSVKSLKNTSRGIRIKWEKASSAKGYYIYRKSSSGKYKKIGTIKSGSKVSYTDTSVKNKNGRTYTYKVVPFSGSTKGTGAAKKTVRLTGTELSGVKSTSPEKMTVKWEKAGKISGYQIQYCANRKFSGGKESVTVSSSNTRKVISSLKKGKTYYVRIRTFKEKDGKKYYSAWSSAKKVRIKK